MRNTKPDMSSRSLWSMRLALFAAQLIVVTVLLHRFASLPTAYAINLIVTSLIGAAAAILLSVLSFSQIWNTGVKGTGLALSALLVALTIFAIPLYYLPNLIRLPAINDITTDLLAPPQFQKIAILREQGANSVIYPGNQFISAQAKAYPDISTLRLERSRDDSFDLVHGVIQDLGWKIVREQQPGNGARTGIIEAVDKSLFLGFSDDIVVRVQGNKRFARIDMRSASRYGRHDLGINAKRIREMFSVVKTRIAKAEAKRIDNLERRRIARQTQIDKKKKELVRLRRKRENDAKRGPIMLPKANFDQLGVEPGQGDLDPLSQTGQGNPILNGLSRKSSRKKIRRKGRSQKLRRSKRKRKRKKWVPFKFFP
ncbi:MAG: DUF1499 domain-containing protein [Hyphomicrobiaceae bacterium]|nr:DUF1499 domain-containing protein [Hyphomicrobiaceae bacterium]